MMFTTWEVIDFSLNEVESAVFNFLGGLLFTEVEYCLMN